MAFLFGDSFDTYNTALIATKWGTSTAGAIAAVGRNSTNGFRMANPFNGFTQVGLTPASNTIIMGCALTIGSFSAVITAGILLFSIMDGATAQIVVSFTSSGGVADQHITISKSGTTFGSTTHTLTAGQTYYFEIKVVVATGTGGSIEVRLDGATELSVSGLNTAPSGTGQFNAFKIGGGGSNSTNNIDLDDLYICDSTGSQCNDFLGDVRGMAQVPSTGNGSNTDWTPSTGTDHGALVDDNPPNTSDYNSSNTAGQRDTYNFASLGVTGTVKAVQTGLYISKSDAGTRQVASVHRIGGVNYDGTTKNIGTGFRYLLQVDELSPATGVAWTTGEINGTETGVKLVS